MMYMVFDLGTCGVVALDGSARCEWNAWSDDKRVDWYPKSIIMKRSSEEYSFSETFGFRVYLRVQVQKVVYVLLDLLGL